MTGGLALRVLGPLDVRVGGVQLALGGPKQQVVLGLLAVNANCPIGLDELIDELWPEKPPPSAVANARGYAAGLRRLFVNAEGSHGRLVRQGSGYVLHARSEEVDLLEFSARTTVAREAKRRGDLTQAATEFRRGLALWRGPMLAALPRGPRLEARRVAAEGERLAVVEELAETYLALGEPRRATALLREHVRAQPLRERAYVLLMMSLYRSGEVAEALTVYAEARAALVEQLGIEPGAELQELHRSILNRDSRLDRQTARSSGLSIVPAQLPSAAAHFVGREESLRLLDALLSDEGRPSTVVISAISGTAGIGKTALAVYWAHRVADRFPDGQLYVNLRGFDPGGPPMGPAEAVRGLLDAFEVPPQRIPARLDAQVGLYRSLLAGRRMLVVLDNVRDAEQVRPLLPGSPGCLVLVTSRNQLSSLVAVEGAYPLTLDMLSAPEAWELMIRRLGEDRVKAEPAAVKDIIAACARLPLALAVVASRAATRPDFPIRTLANELREAADGLDAFSGHDAVADVRTVLSWSYRTLNAEAARLFRLLGLHPGPDAGLPAIASLAGLPAQRVRPLLDELIRANLLSEGSPGRYSFHDLLRAYAAEAAYAEDSESDRRAAMQRILDHYLYTAATAMDVLHPAERHRRPRLPWRSATGPAPEDPKVALQILEAEHATLVAVCLHAARNGWPDHAVRLAATLYSYLDNGGYPADAMIVRTEARHAAQMIGDGVAEATALTNLGVVYWQVGRHLEAVEQLTHALALYRELGDRFGEARAVGNLGVVHSAMRQLEMAGDFHRQALDRFVEIGDRVGEANTLTNLGDVYAQLGRYEPAVEHLSRALALFRDLRHRGGEATALTNLGEVHVGLAQHSNAVMYFEQALALFRERGERYGQTCALNGLAEALAGLGNLDQAIVRHTEALTLATEIDETAEQARAQAGLARLHDPAGGVQAGRPV